jgi:hypothetical protein
MVEVERLGFTVLCSGESWDGTTKIGPDVKYVAWQRLKPC